MCAEHQSPKDRVTSERLYVVVRLVITDSVEKWYQGTLHRTDIFTGWQVIIPSGVTTKAHAISYQRTFSDFERVMSSSYGGRLTQFPCTKGLAGKVRV